LDVAGEGTHHKSRLQSKEMFFGMCVSVRGHRTSGGNKLKN